jgi:hypothetical protein
MSVEVAEAAAASARLPLSTRRGVRDLLARTPVRVALISALVLVPCFWHSRIQAGDLSSHLYNAWLSLLIADGKAPGLHLVSQPTNVVFDLLLSGLMRLLGPWAAEHIAVPLVVLVFVWGAFAFISSVSCRLPWHLLGIVAMLAYGWVFHMGFLNFYLSVGLCCWAFALLWKRGWKPALGALPLVALAYLAHALPVAWLAGAAAYTWLARRMRPRLRPVLAFAGVALLAVTRQFLIAHFPTRWDLDQAVSMTGADQISVFESRYHLLEFVLVAIWLSLLVRLVRRRGGMRVLLGIPFQLCVIASAGVFLLPGAILPPGYLHELRYIAGRMSLIVGVSGCALVGQAMTGKREKAAMAIVLGLFFSFLYADTHALNHLEDLIEQRAAAIPPGSRVISALCIERGDTNLVGHSIDRACIGRCFSYANYEPSTAQFRVRADPGNPLVASTYRDSAALQTGSYVVTPSDLPLYQIYLRGHSIETRLLHAGDVTGATCIDSASGSETVASAPGAAGN